MRGCPKRSNGNFSGPALPQFSESWFSESSVISERKTVAWPPPAFHDYVPDWTWGKENINKEKERRENKGIRKRG